MITTEELNSLVSREHMNPHAVLGPHAHNGGIVVRALRPDARSIAALIDGGARVELEQIHLGGVFEGLIEQAQSPFCYRLDVDYGDAGRLTIDDPYTFEPTLGARDLRLLSEGHHEELYDKLGAHVREHHSVIGTSFAVWAPSARAISVVGDFNSWDGRLHAMRSLGASGIWELFLPGVEPGVRYKYEILAADGERTLKADPCAQEAELPPRTASVVFASRHRWSGTDGNWQRDRREQQPLGRPISIYEVHLGSWRRNTLEANRPLTYLELADELCEYVRDLGFTHIELLPVMAHPFRGSWGYQVTGYFAPSPRHGPPDHFRQFVDRMHANRIGVIVDWVPAHFPRDEFALARFDGSCLYEHADARRSAHPDWGTLVFDYARPEVRNFLIANALFWLREYHVDGIRVDAVASMLYLDFSRQEGEWAPNHLGGRENLEAVSFIQELNEVIHRAQPGIISAAEETATWPGVSRPAHRGGLGFGFKWNTGWMHDTLGYFQRDPTDRRDHHRELTFGLMYAFTENFILPLCHDDVVPGKGSLYKKMAGDPWQKLANLRALYAYMWAHPGKKLLFMGSELGPEAEWSHEHALDWHLLEQPGHAGVQSLIRDLNRAYRDQPALWELDADQAGFSWLEPDDADGNVIAFARAGRAGSSGEPPLLVFVANLSPVPRPGYRLGLPRSCTWREALNTDSISYGGGGLHNLGDLQPEAVSCHGQPVSAEVTLPPLTAIWLVPHPRSTAPSH